MVDYALKKFLPATPPETDDAVIGQMVVPYLVDQWVGAYLASTRHAQLVETTVDRFSYLFDIAQERLIAAWGISRGSHPGERPKSRMAGHPSPGIGFHRGHAIAHSLGGCADINLVAQRGSVNCGAFRVLELRAVATPGSLYFSHWRYGAAGDRVPVAVEQGLISPGREPDIRLHSN